MSNKNNLFVKLSSVEKANQLALTLQKKYEVNIAQESDEVFKQMGIKPYVTVELKGEKYLEVIQDIINRHQCDTSMITILFPKDCHKMCINNKGASDMAKSFDVCELIQVAISEKQNGVHFYKMLSGITANPHLKNEFLWFSEQENKHLNKFHVLLNEMKQMSTQENFSDTIVDYLKLIVAQNGKDAILQKINKNIFDDKALLKEAMFYEKRQLSLQIDIAGIIESDYHDIILQMIEEEREHIVKISKLKESLSILALMYDIKSQSNRSGHMQVS